MCRYRTILAGGETIGEQGGVRVCDLSLEQSADDGHWRVIDEACNESSG